ncbi:MAG: DUF87 domain-containing protein [candidate division WOR-3 bacterium]
MSIQKGVNQHNENKHDNQAKNWFQKLVQEKQYIGELYSINYETARIIIHDYQKNKVGGVPSLSFLIATRVNPYIDETVDFQREDSSVILLRVMDAAPLPQEKEYERIRTEVAQRVSGEADKHWDTDGVMDAKTRNLLSFAAVECRIIGTFYLDLQHQDQNDSDLILKFGCDISNYYPNKGLKVYKPNAEALETIVNYTDFANQSDLRSKARVQLGTVRYASTNRRFQQIDNVKVSIYPSDLLSQKSAVFGMTRTGKSNTTKIIAKSIYELRYPKNSDDKPLRIGQIIFDPNGEYANENAQDTDGKGNANALKNVYQVRKDAKKEDEVVTYGITPHPNDPDRKLMLLNFYLEDNLQIGKEIINSLFTEDNTNYIKNFLQVSFEKPDANDRSALTRYNRRVLAYRAVLNRAGFQAPTNIAPSTKGLFNKELIQALRNSQGDNSADYQSAAQILENPNPNWSQLANALEILDKFIRDTKSGYQQFETAYVNRPNGSGERWADEDFKKIIGIFQYANGVRKIGKAIPQHTHTTSSDYAEDIYKDLVAGKLVIIDQSSGEPEINKSAAERIMWTIFRKNQALFREGKTNIPDIMIYIEEAHNLLPSGSDLDMSNVWVRTAKEGAKYHIGMVYSTQEVSSIQKNILKNTANWFIGHLNNTDETKELCKYYDFADFEQSIRRTQDKGFLRVKTLSNYFVIPVQVKKFDVTDNS